MISFAACLSELEGLQLRKDMQSLGDSDNANTDRVTLCTRTLQSSLSLLDLILDDLEGLSLMDLILLEQQVHGILRRVGAKKDELILEQLEDIKEEMCVVYSSKTCCPKLVFAALLEDLSQGEKGFEYNKCKLRHSGKSGGFLSLSCNWLRKPGRSREM
eukprot:c25011_g1_i7 orf=190-666(+)